jgi:hypothetical protein
MRFPSRSLWRVSGTPVPVKPHQSGGNVRRFLPLFAILLIFATGPTCPGEGPLPANVRVTMRAHVAGTPDTGVVQMDSQSRDIVEFHGYWIEAISLPPAETNCFCVAFHLSDTLIVPNQLGEIDPHHTVEMRLNRGQRGAYKGLSIQLLDYAYYP